MAISIGMEYNEDEVAGIVIKILDVSDTNKYILIVK
jgi:hypothetical protein